MLRSMKCQFVVIALFAVFSIGLVSSAQAQEQMTYEIDVSSEQSRAGGECSCHIDVGGAIECAVDGGPCVDNDCMASGDADCPGGLCVSAAQTGCGMNQCIPQTDFCNGPCTEPSTIGNLVLCAEVPTVSEWGMVLMTLLILTAGSIVIGRRRRAAVA